MCGIFGSVGAPVAHESLAKVKRVLAHRGPEAHGVQSFEGATFVHTRLRINDLSPAGAQPMANEDRTVWVTFNGEIYNFRDLRRELAARGHSFSSASDTEAIVHGYEEWGDDIVRRLDGMFAFGIWDTRRRRLLLARDRAGKKPLYYVSDGNGLHFASEMKALFAAGHAVRVDEDAVVATLAQGYATPPSTPYLGMSEVPAAHLLALEPLRPPTLRRYWQPDFHPSEAAPSEREATHRVQTLVEQAVAKRLVADVPVGAFLSGGVDSSIVVAVMTKLGKRVQTFAVGSADAAYDEAPHARQVAAHFGTSHTEVRVGPQDLQLIDELVWHYDGPPTDSSAVPTYVVSKLARQHVTVALTGDGGDELFAGYLRFGAAAATERLPAVVRAVLQRAARALPPSSASRSVQARAKRLLDVAARPLADRIATWTWPPSRSLIDMMLPERQGAVDAAFGFHRGHFAPGSERTVLARLLEHNFTTYLPQDLLVKVDRCSMAHALEARSPFLDQELVAYVAKLPDRFKRRWLTGKYILKKAFAEVLPPMIVKRPKMGFGIPLGRWFRGEMHAYLMDHIGGSDARVWGYVRKEGIATLVAEHMRGESDHGQTLWTLLAVEIWLRSLNRLGVPPATVPAS